ncbi:MAG: UDP-N-acetylmuramoyl-L-alanine--D-glutamate ligase, partial [Candidatus Subteraquimicrobiales bacterium]|nr:UDP-N-acetylmuramoyl-L-alanine--D-glutamate ligase [Candidatus Subteraquimicrobiales bacterium]
MKLPQSKVLVIGLGKSGVAAAEKLNSLGTTVLATDSSTGAEIKKAALSLKNRGIKIHLGEHDCSLLNEIDLIVVSPGVPIRTPILKEAKKRKVSIWSEVELAYRLTDSKIIGITGTNGKTTTTTLIGSILKQGGYEVIVAGNIGFPLVKAIDEATRETTIVTELSSFQLETIVEFRPFISVLLNITEDHLDWHTDFKDY